MMQRLYKERTQASIKFSLKLGERNIKVFELYKTSHLFVLKFIEKEMVKKRTGSSMEKSD